MDERKPRTETANGFKNGFGSQTNYPLTPIEKAQADVKALLDASKKDIERKKEEANLQILKVAGMVAAAREALPVIDRVIGNPNHTLAMLTDFALRQGCDVAEVTTTLEFHPES